MLLLQNGWQKPCVGGTIIVREHRIKTKFLNVRNAILGARKKKDSGMWAVVWGLQGVGGGGKINAKVKK